MLIKTSWDGIAVVTYDPLPAITLCALHEVRRGYKSLIPSAEWLYNAEGNLTQHTLNELSTSLVGNIGRGSVLGPADSRRPSPFALALEPLRPNSIARINQPAGYSLDEYSMAGGIGSHPGLAFGTDLTGLMLNSKAMLDWLNTLSQTTIASSIYAEMRAVRNKSRIMASTDADETRAWLSEYVPRVPGYGAGLCALAALDQFSGQPSWLMSLMTDSQPYIDQLMEVPLPLWASPVRINIGDDEFRKRHQVSSVICLPVFPWLESSHLHRPATMMAPGFRPYWDPITFSTNSDPDSLLMIDGIHFRKWTGRINNMDDLEALQYAYSYYAHAIACAAGPQSYGVEVLREAASNFSSLWSGGEGAVRTISVSGLPIETNPFLGPNLQEQIASVYCGKFGTSHEFTPALTGPILSASRLELTWDHVTGDEPIVAVDNPDPVVLISTDGDFTKTPLISIPNENVPDLTSYLGRAPALLTPLFLGRRIAEMPHPACARFTVDTSVGRLLTAYLQAQGKKDTSTPTDSLTTIILPNPAVRAEFLKWIETWSVYKEASTLAKASLRFIAAQLWSQYAKVAPSEEDKAASTNPSIGGNDGRGTNIIVDEDGDSNDQAIKDASQLAAAVPPPQPPQEESVIAGTDSEPKKGGKSPKKGSGGGTPPKKIAVPNSPGSIPDILTYHTDYPWQRVANVSQGSPVVPLPSVISTESEWFGLPGMRPMDSLGSFFLAGEIPNEFLSRRFTIHPAAHVGSSVHRISNVASSIGNPNSDQLSRIITSAMKAMPPEVLSTIEKKMDTFNKVLDGLPEDERKKESKITEAQQALLKMNVVINTAGSAVAFRERVGKPADSWCLYATVVSRQSKPAYYTPNKAPSDAVIPNMVLSGLVNSGVARFSEFSTARLESPKATQTDLKDTETESEDRNN